MPTPDSAELARFKTDIHLVEYACARHGYQRDRAASSHSSHVLRHAASDDKIVVGRDTDGHWIYFSIRDSRDNGTVVDFVQRRGAASLGDARAELRDWLGTPRPDLGPDVRPATVPAPRDRLAIAATWAQLPEATNSPYLNARGIRPETLQDPRLAGTWTMARGNTLFVHRDVAGDVTGYEIKGPRFTGFAKGGTKSAWSSDGDPLSTRTLVLTETAVDAISYAQLHPAHRDARYVSTAGAPSSAQLEQLGAMIRTLPERGLVIAAFDHDAPGNNYAATVGELARTSGRALRLERHTPPYCKDWNEQLQRVERDYIRALPASVRALAPNKALDR